jgi:hypothetical protein
VRSDTEYEDEDTEYEDEDDLPMDNHVVAARASEAAALKREAAEEIKRKTTYQTIGEVVTAALAAQCSGFN